MRRAILILLCSLLIPSAFAQWDALKLHNETSGVPSFVGRHIHGVCGDLDVSVHHITGTIQNRVVEFHHDGNGVFTFTHDTETVTGYTDADGTLMQLVGPKGELIRPLRLTPEQVKAAVQRMRASILALVDSCGLASIPTTKCGVLTDGFSSPNDPGSPSDGTAVDEAGTVQRKDCTGGDETSADFWNGFIAAGGYYDPAAITAAIDPTLACMQARDACMSSCDRTAMQVGVICTIAGSRSAVAAVVCGIVDYAWWDNCKANCAARYPC